MRTATAATIAYTIFYVVLELAAFGSVIAARGAGAGGLVGDYTGLARRSPLAAGAFVLALAGLPAGLAGLFAKVTVIDSLLDGEALWLAIVVALNAVIGLATALGLLLGLAPQMVLSLAGG
jgi:NADH-quinone oxidoreductase subunit N